MSFNRLNYDTGTYTQELNQSVGPGAYQLGQPPISCNPCYQPNPTVGLGSQGDSVGSRGDNQRSNKYRIDIDSELLGITRKSTRDPEKKYLASCPDNVCTSGEICGQGVVGKCDKKGLKKGQRYTDDSNHHLPDCFFPKEYTRISNPPCNLRSTGWNRFEWLCRNPQERVEIPFDYNISNRIIVKDNHRPCIPSPIDPTLALPKGGALPCEQTEPSCSTYTNPKSVNSKVCDDPCRIYGEYKATTI